MSENNDTDACHTLASVTHSAGSLGIVTDPAEQLAIRAEIGRLARRLPAVARKHERSITPRGYDVSKLTLSGRALRWLLPWDRKDYPGFHAGSVEFLRGRRAGQTIRDWKRGKVPLPGWVADVLAVAIRERCEAGLAIVAELEARAAEAARTKRYPGFLKVDPVTGLSGRSSAGHRHGVKSV